MKKLWEQLKPQERRAVTFVGVVLFLVLNYFMVWPKFKEWGVNEKRMKKANDNITTYQAEIRHRDEYTRRIASFDSDNVPPEDQNIHFQNYYQDRALENGIEIQNTSPLRKLSPNDYFLEQQVTIQAVASQNGLVNFLYSLGSSNSMVRVRNLTVHPADLNRYKLHAEVVIVASYKKTKPTAPARATTTSSAAPTPKPAAPAARPATPAPGPVTPGGRPLNVTNKPGTPNTKRL